MVGAATRELAFEYHDKGYIALESNLGFEDGKTISFSQGGNTVTATDDENGFSEDDIGKYIYTGDGWHKILSVSDVTIVGCGKNLLKPQGNATVDGVTYTLQDNGTYLANGTVAGTGLLIMYKGVLPPGQYTISGGAGGIQVSLSVHKADGTYIRTICASHNGASTTGTVTELTGEEAYHQAFIQAVSAMVGQTVTNVVLSPQLEAGDTATAFEAYEDVPLLSLDNAQGQISQVEVEVGCDVTSKNMIDINSLTTTTNTSLSVRMDQLRVYTTGDGGTWRGGSTRNFVLRKGVSYTLSAELVEYVSGDAYVAIRNASDNKIIQALSLDFGTTPTTMSKTYTPDSNMTVYFTAFCSNDSVLTGDVTYREIQLEVGDEATAYEAYKGLAGKDKITITACGKNLIDPGDLYTDNSKVEMNVSGDSVRVYTTGAGGIWLGASAPVFWIRKGVSYTLSAELANYVSGNARIGLRNVGTGTFLSEATVIFGSTPGTLTKTFTPESDEWVYLSALCTNSTVFVGDCTFADIQLEVGNAATDYEPYHDMGGGTVTPTEPLYGLPGAEDTVEVSVDGDVTVTRRTAVLVLDGTENWVRSLKNNHGYYYRLSVANIFQITTSIVPNLICSHYRTEAPSNQWGGTDSCISQNYIANMRTEVLIYDTNYAESDLATWKSYLAAQKTAGTPVTIVYELAAPTTETPADVDPIEPNTGEVNVFTDADSLNITLYKTENNKYASVTGSFSQTQNGFASMLAQMNEISISGEDVELTKLEIDYVPQVR